MFIIIDNKTVYTNQSLSIFQGKQKICSRMQVADKKKNICLVQSHKNIETEQFSSVFVSAFVKHNIFSCSHTKLVLYRRRRLIVSFDSNKF